VGNGPVNAMWAPFCLMSSLGSCLDTLHGHMAHTPVGRCGHTAAMVHLLPQLAVVLSEWPWLPLGHMWQPKGGRPRLSRLLIGWALALHSLFLLALG
jgi:hypothetical protein